MINYFLLPESIVIGDIQIAYYSIFMQLFNKLLIIIQKYFLFF